MKNLIANFIILPHRRTMHKIVIIILITASNAVCLYSQMTLTSAYNPVIGDIQYQVSVDTTGISPGNSGANQTWNFQNLIRIDSIAVRFIDPAATPYGSSFPQSNICAHDTCYDYFKTSSQQLEYVGYNSQNLVVLYTNFETVISYPFTYNSTANDNFSANINSGGDVIIRTGSVNIIGDGYGLLNLPFGAFLNALRIKSIINIKDSSTTYQMSVNTTYTAYAWFVPGKKFSVFNILYSTITIPGYGTVTGKNVFYNPVSTPIGIRTISSSLPQNFSLSQNYPNPFNPSTTITFEVPSRSNVTLKVYDILGREVSALVNQEINPGKYSVDWDAGNLSSGTYFYRLQTENYSETKLMVLTK